jgi:phosphopantothenoylcysteine decarboxylase/phosphopantothenate--cysteine ligase
MVQQSKMLKGKKIILGVTGSIAAYKAAYLCRLLVKNEAEVQVVMTQSASAFVSPLTFSTLSKKPVVISMFDDESNWNNHVNLGLWANLMLVAPASANSLAKMGAGICDNLLLAVYLSAKCPVVVAPWICGNILPHKETFKSLNKTESK